MNYISIWDKTWILTPTCTQNHFQRVVYLNMDDKTIKLSEENIFPFGVDNDFLNSTEEMVAIKGKYDMFDCI